MINLVVYWVLLGTALPSCWRRPGGCVAVTNNFLWNRQWTFPHQAAGSRTGFQAARFFLVSVITFLRRTSA